MNIPIKTDKDFEKHMRLLGEEYGEDFDILNGFHESQLNFSDFIDGFVDKKVADVTIDANANASNKDIRSMINEKGKPLDKLFAFSKIFYEMKKMYNLRTAKEWLEQEYSGGYYLHDAPSSTYIPYCYAYDLTRLAREGLFFLKNYNAKAPNHLTTFLDDVIEYISYMSNRSSGAVGIPNILIWTYYFWKKDCESGYFIKDPDYYIRQSFQKLIYRLNQPFMRIDQTAFVNVSIFDRNYIESLFGGVQYPDGSYVIDNIEELIAHQKVFMEVVSEIRSENMFTFPVLTYSLLKRNNISGDEAKEMIRTHNYHVFVDEDFARWCSDHNCTWNDSNFFMSDDVTTLSNCCRLLSDTTKLSGFINSIGGTALSIGSVKVNTINLMRIALETELADDREDAYLRLLRRRALLCCKTLDVVRHIIKRNVEKGLLPNYQDGAVEMSKQYCTIGILGLFEVIESFGYIAQDEFGNISYTDDGIRFASKIFEVLNDVKDNFTKDYSFNIESVPAERAAVILCQKDNKLFELDDKFIYSNQWIPLSAKCTIQEKLRLSAILDAKCSGGSIAHINLESNFPNTDMAWEMLNQIALQDVIYFAFNTRINECKNHHGFVGQDHCPVCGEPVFDTYQRVVGYLVPTRSYSKDRFREFNTRKWFEYAEMMRE
ncbi:MAG: anaerobic ribonucleoside-triphosphate reductase [Clostridia bacterium]|nr:anaerobic ribonucleoside-triphosphate reductase [Clostridia bacterium]